jgi:hypothetical protein
MGHSPLKAAPAGLTGKPMGDGRMEGGGLR